MRKIRVHFLAGNLPLYKELLENPPRSVEYLRRPSRGAIEYYSKFNRIKRKIVLNFIKLFKLPRIAYIFTDADLIHSTRGICILNGKPWIIDIDHASAFVGFNHKRWGKKRYRKIVERLLSSNYCKKIMPWSAAAMKSLLNSFPNNKEIEKKIEVIYPATLPHDKKRKKRRPITLLFVGSNPIGKGGFEVLRAFKDLRKKYDVRLIVKSDIPGNVRNKFESPETEFHPYKTEILPRAKLLENFFTRADVFVYPTYNDIFGLCLLDALAVGLPVVTTDIFAIPEIIEDGKNGFLIHSPIRWHDDKYLGAPIRLTRKGKNFIVQQLIEKLSTLIENTKLMKKMSRHARFLVEKGKFSVKVRNKKLRKIYEDVVGI